MDKKDTIEKMDKLVRRVTVVQGSGEDRRADVVYENDDEDDDDRPDYSQLERRVRRKLKEQMIAAQEAYQRHLDSAEKGGTSWMTDMPRNLGKTSRKGTKGTKGSRSSFPIPRFDAFGIPRFDRHGALWPKLNDDDDDED